MSTSVCGHVELPERWIVLQQALEQMHLLEQRETQTSDGKTEPRESEPLNQL